ncbi:MAG TPA: TetR/AcrR family transcriptional regulator [Caulobacteraceae bacterium]|nr:TetR/AcrR family transcriptional regulator [Caulobacteraceae bacterium]
MNAIAKPDRDERREGIVAIAREVFMEEGYGAASMSAIAARVGGSKGTLYNYFKSKAELFGAVIQDDCATSQAALFDLEAAGGDIEKILHLLGGRVLRLLLSDEVIAVHRIVVAECARFPELSQAHFEAGPRQSKERLRALFVKAMDEGKLRRADPARAAEHAIELILAGLYKRRLWNMGPMPTDADIDANVEAGVAVFMAAYGPK